MVISVLSLNIGLMSASMNSGFKPTRSASRKTMTSAEVSATPLCMAAAFPWFGFC